MSDTTSFEYQLQHNRIWEGSGTVLEIVSRGTNLYRVVFFSESNGSLNFVQVALYKESDKLERLVNKLGVKPRGDHGIVLKEVPHEKSDMGE